MALLPPIQAGNARQALRDACFAMSYSATMPGHSENAPVASEAAVSAKSSCSSSVEGRTTTATAGNCQQEAWAQCRWSPALISAAFSLEALAQYPEAALYLARVR